MKLFYFDISVKETDYQSGDGVTIESFVDVARKKKAIVLADYTEDAIATLMTQYSNIIDFSLITSGKAIIL